VRILSHRAGAAIGQLPEHPPEELAAARTGAAALLGLGGDADGPQFIAVTVRPAGQAQAEDAGIQLVGFALAVEGDGGDEEALRAGGDQLAVQPKAEPATLLHAEDLQAFGRPLSDLGDEGLRG